MLVLAGTLILLSEKDLASRWGIRLIETDDLSEEGRRVELVAARCDEIARQCRLSPREDEILRLLAQGTSNQTIERELFIANGTLKAHIQHIYAKIGVHSRKELLALFEDAGALEALQRRKAQRREDRRTSARRMRKPLRPQESRDRTSGATSTSAQGLRRFSR